MGNVGRMKYKGLFLVLLLAACAPAESEQVVLRIALSPSAQPISEAMLNCAPERVFTEIDPYYPGTYPLSEYDLAFQLGEPMPEAGFAAQVAWERIVLAANHNFVGQGLNREQAADLFSGRPEGDTLVSLWIGPEHDESRQAFSRVILLGAPYAPETKLAASPQLMMEALAADSNAVGVTADALAPDTVQIIELGIELPLLAVSAEEPSGAARELLACLQSPGGQAEVAETYRPVSE
jgi:hypothetical protein